MKNYVSKGKFEQLVEVDLIKGNPEYGNTRLQDKRETTISLCHWAPPRE